LSNQKSDTVAIAAVAATVLVVDQVTKTLVRPHTGTIEVIPGWLEIQQVPNTHGAFGFFGHNTLLLVAMAVLVLVIFWFSFKDAAHKSRTVRIAFGMIVGGAIGNIIDRFHYGYVVDFINFDRWPQYWYYTFNVADACITTGVALLIISSLVTRRRA
jgi:signal peptidase II